MAPFQKYFAHLLTFTKNCQNQNFKLPCPVHIQNVSVCGQDTFRQKRKYDAQPCLAMHDGMAGTGGPPGQLTLLHGAVHLQEAVRRQALPDIRVGNKKPTQKTQKNYLKPTRNVFFKNFL